MYEASLTVARSMGQAAAASARLIETCVDHAVAQLQEAESQATRGDQRQQLADAWRELLARRSGFASRFPHLLGGALKAEAAGRKPEGATTSLADSSFASLTLVDDDAIARSIESSRLAQQLAAALERPLGELDALMSSALGLEVVHPERNPLRPEVFAQVLRDTMAEATPEPAWMSLWLRQMAKPLAQGLDRLYRDQAQFLTHEKVSAASYRVNASTSRAAPLTATPPGAHAGGGGPMGNGNGNGNGGSASGAGMPGGMAGAAAGGSGGAHAGATTANGGMPGPADAAHDSQLELPSQGFAGARLRQFLLGGDPQATRSLAPSYYAQVDAELQALEDTEESTPYDPRAAREHMHLPPVQRPQRSVGTDSPLPPEVWGRYAASRQRSLVRGQLKKQVREAGQVWGLELVRKLVDTVGDDPRLLAPVREAIVALEPSLLRLAMVAPRFFSDEQHPGRLLVEGVAERSFKYNDEFSVEFQSFFMPVSQAFQRLNQVEEFEDAEAFRAALATLQAGWSAQDGLDEEAQQKMLGAVKLAERRQLEAARIASDLSRRADLEGVHQAVRDFVLGTWTLVLAHARLSDPRHLDPGGYLAVVADLLWSVKRELALHEPARAFVLIPRLVGKLREGLGLLGHPPAESENFFRRLESLHSPVLRLRARHRNSAFGGLEPARVVIEDAAPASSELPAERLWLAPDEMRAAGFEDTTPSDFAGLAPAAGAQEAAAEEDDDPARMLDSLTLGSWVDLYSRQQWRRAKLVWAAERRTLFMFVSHPGQPHSMTRRSLQRLVQQQLLRRVESGGVVPRALEQMAQERSAPAASAPAHALA